MSDGQKATGEAIDPAVLADVAARVQGIRERIAQACRRRDRDPDSVRLVGACKRQPLERIAAAICAGLSELGENYAQEARDKQQPLQDLLARHFGAAVPPRFHWRMIGHLQSNKARLAAGLFDAIDTVDRPSLARALERHASERRQPLEVCLQVNLSGEAQKSGLPETELPELLARCHELQHLRVVGLMTMPAPHPDTEAARPVFARLRALRDTLCRRPEGKHLQHLNMGMSADFEIAVEEGATLVRVGTALFGEREARA